VEVALALHEQADAAAQNVAPSHAPLDWQRGIEPTEHWVCLLQLVPLNGRGGQRREVTVERLERQLAHGYEQGWWYRGRTSNYQLGNAKSRANMDSHPITSTTWSKN
jgi:hypothetical protein